MSSSQEEIERRSVKDIRSQFEQNIKVIEEKDETKPSIKRPGREWTLGRRIRQPVVQVKEDEKNSCPVEESGSDEKLARNVSAKNRIMQPLVQCQQKNEEESVVVDDKPYIDVSHKKSVKPKVPVKRKPAKFDRSKISNKLVECSLNKPLEETTQASGFSLGESFGEANRQYGLRLNKPLGEITRPSGLRLNELDGETVKDKHDVAAPEEDADNVLHSRQLTLPVVPNMDEEGLVAEGRASKETCFSVKSAKIRSSRHKDPDDPTTSSAIESTYQLQHTSKVVVISIDFGTTHSGYAFLFKHDYMEKNMNILCNLWHDVGQANINVKTQTCLLLHKDTTLHSFGHRALTAYSEFSMDRTNKDYYFFWNFKMNLHQEKEITKDFKIKDITGKELDALTVFSRSIQFFREHLLATVNNRTPEITEADMGWIITVPAIWSDSAKKFMRLAAEKAGIPGANIEVALEPEAASLYCRMSPLAHDATSATSVQSFPVGIRYLIADCGGGTVDIAVHEVLEGNTLKELYGATGGNWGGNRITKNIWDYIGKVVGEDVLKSFEKECKHEYLELMQEIEEKKRKTDPTNTETVSIKLPSGIFRKFKEMKGKDLCNKTVAAKLKAKESFVGDKLRMPSKRFESFFANAVQDVVAHIHALLESLSAKEICINVLLLVGGFSDSPVLQKKIKNAFGDRIKIVIPPEASLCVVKGAVLFGFEPQRITERISRYTFGIEQTVKFDPEVHSETRKTVVNKKEMVDGVFDIHVRVGDVVKYGEFQSKRVYYPISPFDLQYFVNLYRSKNKEPQFTDEDGCDRVACFYMDRPFQKGISTKDEAITVRLAFGHSDIVVEVTAKDGSKITPECKLNS